MATSRGGGGGARLALAATALLVAGCVEFGGDDDGAMQGMIPSAGGALVGEFTPDPDPPAVGQNALAIELADPDGEPVEGATVTVDAYMPAMGHGLPAEPVVEEIGGGSYLATEIAYTMSGEWEVTVGVAVGPLADSFALAYQVE